MACRVRCVYILVLLFVIAVVRHGSCGRVDQGAPRRHLDDVSSSEPNQRLASLAASSSAADKKEDSSGGGRETSREGREDGRKLNPDDSQMAPTNVRNYLGDHQPFWDDIPSLNIGNHESQNIAAMARPWAINRDYLKHRGMPNLHNQSTRKWLKRRAQEEPETAVDIRRRSLGWLSPEMKANIIELFRQRQKEHPAGLGHVLTGATTNDKQAVQLSVGLDLQTLSRMLNVERNRKAKTMRDKLLQLGRK